MLPVIFDSPMAQRITSVYRHLHGDWRKEARERLMQGRDPFGFSQLISIDTHARHQQVVNYLNSTGRPAIVMAGNGMCSGGRIVNYLKTMLGDARHEVMFVGYQAQGTPGAVIQASADAEGVAWVELDGERHVIKAKAVTIGGYSAHADQSGLLSFVEDIPCWPGKIILVHGSGAAKIALKAALERRAACRGDDCIVDIAD
ncbi:Metallo-beta-lactamase family protein [Pseudomonas putida]|nr:Metallo-beta-lactamase family protein [Pseudomonas putida]